MRKKTHLPLLIGAFTLLSGCSRNNPSQPDKPVGPVNPDETELEDLQIIGLDLNVYGKNNEIEILNKEEGETFEYTFDGDSIRIEDDKVIALRATDSEIPVHVTSSLGREGDFLVNVVNRPYVSKHAAAEKNEGWFNSVSIDKVNKMTSEFANGMDISSLKQLYDNGQKFYDKDGRETSLLYILKDAGVNWVRLRLWNEPYDTWTDENGKVQKFEYGGGNCTKENMAWIAHEAKAAGLKVLLDFHYSDFWADPTHQIIPKMWANLDSVDKVAKAMKEYTADTLRYFKNKDALPDMVAIGNETRDGLFIKKPGPITKEARGDNPKYVTECTNNPATRGWYEASNPTKEAHQTLRKYIQAGIDGVNEVDPTILKSLHYVRGLSANNHIINFFKVFDDMDIDVYSISAYSYYHFTRFSDLTYGLNAISNAFPNKKIAIAETSYGFTYETDSNASNIFIASGDKNDAKPISGYPATIQGQAKILRDTSEVVTNLPQNNGFGCFYWEGAWTPTNGCGWADKGSKATWANQGLFSYDGKALGSLEVYNKMLGK